MAFWIKCSDKLPKTDVDVLVADENWQAVAYLNNGEWKPANVDCGDNFRVYLDFTPTHWADLSDLPV